jgi:hypothetical protein
VFPNTLASLLIPVISGFRRVTGAVFRLPALFLYPALFGFRPV